MGWYEERSDEEVVVVWDGSRSEVTAARSGYGEGTEPEARWMQGSPWSRRRGHSTEKCRAIFFQTLAFCTHHFPRHSLPQHMFFFLAAQEWGAL